MVSGHEYEHEEDKRSALAAVRAGFEPEQGGRPTTRRLTGFGFIVDTSRLHTTHFLDALSGGWELEGV